MKLAKFVGPMIALFAFAIFSAGGILILQGDKPDLELDFSIISISLSITMAVWITYDHVRQHELIDIQLEKFERDKLGFGAWKRMDDLEKYIKIRQLFAEFMLTHINSIRESHGMLAKNTLTSALHTEGFDGNIFELQLVRKIQVEAIYQSFMSQIRSLDNAKYLEESILPFDEIYYAREFLRDRIHIE